jgi:cell division protein FtsL
MRREADTSNVPMRARPTLIRAAAAARLAGAPSGEDAVAARMRHAAHRSRSFDASSPTRSPTRSAHRSPRASSADPSPSRSVAVPRSGRSFGVSSPERSQTAASRRRSLTAPSPGVSGAAALAVAPPVKRPLPGKEEQARPRHLWVVPEGLTPAQRRRRARMLLMTGIGAAAAIALALVYFHVVLAQRQFAIDRLQSQVQKAQATYQDQRLQVAQLGSPQHIISMAEGQLGMIQPSNVTYLTPSGGGGASTAASGQRPLGQPVGAAAGQPPQAPAGDANWPEIKSQLAGIP